MLTVILFCDLLVAEDAGGQSVPASLEVVAVLCVTHFLRAAFVLAVSLKLCEALEDVRVRLLEARSLALVRAFILPLKPAL